MPSKKRKRAADSTNNSKDTTVASKKRRIQTEIDIHKEIIQILSHCKENHENTIDIKMMGGTRSPPGHAPPPSPHQFYIDFMLF